MSIINKVKYLDVTADVTIEQIADALGCNGFSATLSDVEYGILTMEDISGATMPTCGFAISGLGTTTWTLYPYINGRVSGTNLRTITGRMSYIVGDNYKIFASGSIYFGYGFLRGKDTTMPNTPEMWECYTQYSGNTSTANIHLWDKYSTSTNSMQNLIALTNDNDLTILTPLFNYTTGWLSGADVYYTIERPSGYNISTHTYNFIMNEKEYVLLTAVTSSLSNARTAICFDVTNVPDIE